MVHSVGRSVRLPTHHGRALGVDRPSAIVVEKRLDGRDGQCGAFRQFLISS